MGLVFIFDLEATFDLCLYFKTFLFKVAKLLNQYCALLGQLEVLLCQLFVVRFDPIIVILQIHQVLLQLIPLKLCARIRLYLALILLREIIQLILKRSEHQQLSFLVELFPFNLLHLLLFLRQFI